MTLKRSGFKNKSLAEIKAKQALKLASGTKLPKANKKAKAVAKRKPQGKVKTQAKRLKAAKNELWELCKQIIRQNYKKEDGTWVCFTCGKIIDIPVKAQTGHGIPSAVGGALLRYHLDNLRIQDYYCNINLGGNGGEFYKRLVIEIGQDKVDEIYLLKQQSIKADLQWYLDKIEHYKQLLKSPSLL
jgi:hypothetical protein